MNVAVGYLASVAIGQNSGNQQQGMQCVAIGVGAGRNIQGAASVAIGFKAGETNLGGSSIAIGAGAITDQFATSAIALGASARADFAQSICIGPNCRDNNGAGFYLSTVRQITGGQAPVNVLNIGLVPTQTGYELIYWQIILSQFSIL